MSRPIQDLDWYLQRLEGVEGADDEFTSWCPCHDDVGTSVKGLSISVRDGKIFMKCHSPHCGATLTRVYKTLAEELEDDDFIVNVVHKQSNGSNGHYPLGAGMKWWTEKTGVEASVWETLGCHDHHGGVAFHFSDEHAIKVRKPPKEIHWEPKNADIPPLWPLPEDELPAHIWITEGESDCGTAAAAGYAAYTVTAGAKGGLPLGWATSLGTRGVERITVCGDADESGVAFSSRVSREAIAAGLAVEVVRLETVVDPFSGINDLNGVWRACETLEEFNEIISRATQQVAQQIPFLTVVEMEREAEREIDWLIPELIAPGDKIMLAAPQKSLKSWIALELVRSIVTGTAFLKRPEWIPTNTKRVGFVQEEGAKSLWARRVAMLNISDNEDAVFAHKTGFRFTEASLVDELISAIRELSLDMVILDPLQRMMPALDANSDNDTGLIWDEVFRIQQAHPHCVVMIVHHANKHDRLSWESIRGSSRHAGEVDLGIFLERDPVHDATLRMWLDGRDIPQYLGTGEAFYVKYELDRDKRIAEFDGTEIDIAVNDKKIIAKDNRSKILAAIQGGASTRAEIIVATEIGDTTVRSHLDQLEEAGMITSTLDGKRKHYTVVES